MKNKKRFIKILILIIFLILTVVSQYIKEQENNKEIIDYSYSLNEIPEYSNREYIYINKNKPDFKEITTTEFEEYSDLDYLGRCGKAYANISKKMMPTKEREPIGSIKPSGWHIVKYDFIDGKYLYNRCHLIAFQLAGENANEKNLITCTRSTNTGIMLDYENKVAEYVKKTNNHVLYRVTPYFKNNDLVAFGIQMEGYSVEDNGKGISFNIFIYNVEKGIDINYLTGESKIKQQ